MKKTVTQLEIERLEHKGKSLLQAVVLNDNLTVPGENRRVKVFGAPGEGKGTLSNNITHILKFGIMDGSGLIRRHMHTLSPEQRAEVDAALRADGKKTLVPDPIVLAFFDKEYEAIQSELKRDGVKIVGHVYDGFPRNSYQAQKSLEKGLRFDAIAHLQSDPYTPTIRQYQRAIEDLLVKGDYRQDVKKAEGRVKDYNDTLPGLLEVLPKMTDRFFVLFTNDTPLVTAYRFFVKASPNGDKLKSDHVNGVSNELRALDNAYTNLYLENLRSTSKYRETHAGDIVDFEAKIKPLEDQRQQYLAEACKAAHS